MIIDSDKIPARMSASAVKALCLLADAKEWTMTALADGVGFTTASSTQMVDALEREGLVMRLRHPTDRRTVLVEMTLRGRELVDSLRPQPEPVEATEREEAVA